VASRKDAKCELFDATLCSFRGRALKQVPTYSFLLVSIHHRNGQLGIGSFLPRTYEAKDANTGVIRMVG